MIGTCPRCGYSITPVHGRVFCVPCGAERRRLIVRNVGRARRRGLPKPLRFCVLCPEIVGPKVLFCPAHKRERDLESQRNVNRKPEVREKMRRLQREPKHKLAAYARQQKPEYKERRKRMYRARYVPKSGRSIACQTLLCTGTFTRNQWNGRRMFCDDCRSVFGLAA